MREREEEEGDDEGRDQGYEVARKKKDGGWCGVGVLGYWTNSEITKMFLMFRGE